MNCICGQAMTMTVKHPNGSETWFCAVCSRWKNTQDLSEFKPIGKQPGKLPEDTQ